MEAQSRNTHPPVSFLPALLAFTRNMVGVVSLTKNTNDRRMSLPRSLLDPGMVDTAAAAAAVATDSSSMLTFVCLTTRGALTLFKP